jgi:hypothetical protein
VRQKRFLRRMEYDDLLNRCRLNLPVMLQHGMQVQVADRATDETPVGPANRPLCNVMNLSLAPRGCNPLARDPRGLVGRQEQRNSRNVVRLPQPAHRDFCNDDFFVVRSDRTHCRQPFRCCCTGRDSIDADLSRSQFDCQNARDRIHGALRGRIDDRVRHLSDTGNASQINHTPSLFKMAMKMACTIAARSTETHLTVQLKDLL